MGIRKLTGVLALSGALVVGPGLAASAVPYPPTEPSPSVTTVAPTDTDDTGVLGTKRPTPSTDVAVLGIKLGALPRTGTEVATAGLFGLALAAGGFLLVRASRKRQHD